MIRATLIFLVVAATVGCGGRGPVKATSKKTLPEPEITPEQARAALLKLDSLPRYKSGENDPILLDLKSGAVARTSDSIATIGKVFSLNLKEKTWRMSVSFEYAGHPKMNFAAGANGKFEYQSDGTWRAIQTGGYIT
jgi:hypothetical protein